MLRSNGAVRRLAKAAKRGAVRHATQRKQKAGKRGNPKMPRAAGLEKTEKKAGPVKKERKPKAGAAEKGASVDRAWFEERMRALRIPSWAAVARDIGIEKSMLTRSIQGTRLFTASDVLLLSRVFSAPPEEIFRRVGYKAMRRGVPIVGVVADSGRVSTVTAVKGRLFDLFDPPAGSKAIIGEFRDARAAICNGATFIYADLEHDNPTPLSTFGQLCVVEAEGFQTPLLGAIVKGASRGKIAIQLFLSEKTEQLEVVYRASPVVAIIFP